MRRYFHEATRWGRSFTCVYSLLWNTSWFTSYIQKQPSRGVLRKKCSENIICSKFTGEYPCRSVVSIKSLCNFFQISLRYECSPVNLVHISRTNFPKNNSGGLLLCSEIMWIKTQNSIIIVLCYYYLGLFGFTALSLCNKILLSINKI